VTNKTSSASNATVPRDSDVLVPASVAKNRKAKRRIKVVHYWDHRAALMINTAQLFGNKNPHGVLCPAWLALEHPRPLVLSTLWLLMSAQQIPVGLAKRIGMLHDHRKAALLALSEGEPMQRPIRHVQLVLDVAAFGFNREWH
jgi:hypothetical protein